MCDDCLTREDVEAIVDERTADLEAENERLREELQKEREAENDHLQERIDDLEERVDELEDEKELIRVRYDAVKEWSENAIAELQSRELEKGAHLKEENVVPGDLEVDGDRVEVIDGDGSETFCRLPGEADPLERSGESVLSNADLLPIQQLARMDDDMLAGATSRREDFLAAKLWAERGKHSPGSVWSAGGPGVREFVDVSDVRVWIKVNHERPDECLSDDWAKKLAGNALERMHEMAKHRGRIIKKNHRKDGLKYKERRYVLDADAEIPGETAATDAPGTNELPG